MPLVEQVRAIVEPDFVQPGPFQPVVEIDVFNAPVAIVLVEPADLLHERRRDALATAVLRPVAALELGNVAIQVRPIVEVLRQEVGRAVQDPVRRRVFEQDSDEVGREDHVHIGGHDESRLRPPHPDVQCPRAAPRMAARLGVDVAADGVLRGGRLGGTGCRWRAAIVDDHDLEIRHCLVCQRREAAFEQVDRPIAETDDDRQRGRLVHGCSSYPASSHRSRYTCAVWAGTGSLDRLRLRRASGKLRSILASTKASSRSSPSGVRSWL